MKIDFDTGEETGREEPQSEYADSTIEDDDFSDWVSKTLS